MKKHKTHTFKAFLTAALVTLLSALSMPAMAGSSEHSISLQSDGTLLAWGNNWYGQLGNGTTIDRTNPVVVTDALDNAITGIQSIATGRSHSLALKSDGTLLAWGQNTLGQLGDGTFTNQSNPVVVTDALGYAITGIQSIAAGLSHSLALKSDGTLLAWGGELGWTTRRRHGHSSIQPRGGDLCLRQCHYRYSKHSGRVVS